MVKGQHREAEFDERLDPATGQPVDFAHSQVHVLAARSEAAEGAAVGWVQEPAGEG